LLDKKEVNYDDLSHSLQLAHKQLVQMYELQIGMFFDALETLLGGMSSGNNAVSVDSAPSGAIEMPHDRLPTWFRCLSYSLASNAESAMDLLSGVGVYFVGQAHSEPVWKPWSFDWRLQSANASAIEFSWHSKGRGHEQDSVPHHVRISADSGRRASLRHCELPGWASVPMAGARRPLPEAQSASRATFGLTLDAERAYDFMRFQSIEVAEALANRIRSRAAASPLPRNGHEVVVYDGMCGAGWLGAALKTLQPEARVYLSDLSADAVALARQNFELNQLSATFLHGDLFAPMRDVISRDATARPHYVFLHPPQTPRLPREYEDDPRLVQQPRMSVHTPTTSHHFLHRIASDLIDILAPGAIAWILVDSDLLQEGRRIFQFAGWRVDDASVAAPELLGMHTRGSVLELTRRAQPELDSLPSWADPTGHGSGSSGKPSSRSQVGSAGSKGSW
jgi:methylase of polypeptide subunit release factors